METTDLVNEVSYLKSLNRTYKSQIDELRYKEQQDWFITLDFYVLAHRPIRDLVSDYKVKQYEHILALLKEKLRTFENPLFDKDKDTGTNRLRLKFVEFIKEAIAECENYEKL